MIFDKLKDINRKPKVFSRYSAKELWTDEHRAKEMLKIHLNPQVDACSRTFEFIDKSVDFIVDRFNLGKNSNIIDFGCGPGLYTARFARKGVKVSGVDFSENSIRYAKNYAKKEGLSIDYYCEDYLEFETEEKFDLITMIFCDFCALNPEQRRVLLKKFKSILKPNGRIFLDVYSINGYNNRKEVVIYEKNYMNNFWSTKNYYCFMHTYKYEGEKVVLDKYNIFLEGGSEVEVYNWLEYFTRNKIIDEFGDNGLEVEEIYSDVSGRIYDYDTTELAIVAK